MIPRKVLQLCGAFALVLAATAMQTMPARALDEARLKKLFDIMDLDGDGEITRPEYQTGKGMVFATLDTNVDFVLTNDELRVTPESFRKVAGDDREVDGMEFLSAEVAAFETIDADQNVVITYPELLAFGLQHAR